MRRYRAVSANSPYWLYMYMYMYVGTISSSNSLFGLLNISCIMELYGFYSAQQLEA